MKHNKFEFQSMIWQKMSWQRTAGAAAFALLLAAGISGCKSADKAPIITSAEANPNGPDPADANLAPVSGNAPATQPTYVAGTSQAYKPQQSAENYGSGQQAPAPIVRGGNNAYLNESQNPNAVDNTQQGYANTGQAYNNNQDQGYNNGQAEGIVEADQPPPQLAEYEQPPAPADNDLWTPGYWNYAGSGYYWVPGAWVSAPYVGALWTPGYWGAYGNRYRWHRGYWGRHVGYYGGINYGWGYVGTGYYGGYWNSNRFYYNRSITRVGPRVQTVYERPVVVNNIRYTSITNNRISYNGGRGGINYQPRPFEVAAMHEQHVGPLPEQQQFHQQAQMNRANFYAENHGRPAQAVLAQPVAVHGFTGPAANPNSGEVNRGGFGRPGVQPGQNPAFQQQQQQQQRNDQAQRLQMEQQRNQGMQERNLQMQQHNNALEQQRNQLQQHNVQAQQQRNFQIQQAQQHTNAAEQQRNLQLQQHNQMEQQRNQMQQQRNIESQQRNNALEQQRSNETAQRNALSQQHNQQMEQQRNQQVEQQRNNMMQQRNTELQQRNAEQVQRNAQVQQQQVQQQQVQQQQRNFQPQPRVEQHVEQPRVQPQPQPQHMEQPHVQQAQPRVEPQHSAPAPQPQGGHPGAEGHPGGHH